jgi:hypothetical protein
MWSRSCAQNATLTCSVLPLEWIKFCGKQLNTALVYLSQKSILGRGDAIMIEDTIVRAA